MLINEAKWIGQQISGLPLSKKDIVLNFGSQTKNYINKNIHIIEHVLKPLSQKCQLKNLDLRSGHGIDYSGNILEDDFFNNLLSVQFAGILLCNVIEHVTNIEKFSSRVGQLVKRGGFLIFTGPYKYPLHYDPIDNGFRPEINEVMHLFKSFKVINAEKITDFTYSYYLFRNKRQLLSTLLRVMSPFYKFRKWKKVVLPKFKWLNKQFEVTCVLMEKGK